MAADDVRLRGRAAEAADALALFFRLVAQGWRVMSAARSSLGHEVYEGWCDDLAQPWQRVGRSDQMFYEQMS